MDVPIYPPLSDRIKSSFIDGILVIVFMFAITSVLDHFDKVPDWVRIFMFVALFIGYEPLLQTMGCTLGNLVMGIRVRKNADTKSTINFFQAIARYPVKIFLGWISFLTLGTDPQKRAMHDMVAGTVMIKA